jgi:azurin
MIKTYRLSKGHYRIQYKGDWGSYTLGVLDSESAADKWHIEDEEGRIIDSHVLLAGAKKKAKAILMDRRKALMDAEEKFFSSLPGMGRK